MPLDGVQPRYGFVDWVVHTGTSNLSCGGFGFLDSGLS